jgi:hypothetical protein
LIRGDRVAACLVSRGMGAANTLTARESKSVGSAINVVKETMVDD